jgi:hypothetical protein
MHSHSRLMVEVEVKVALQCFKCTSLLRVLCCCTTAGPKATDEASVFRVHSAFKYGEEQKQQQQQQSWPLRNAVMSVVLWAAGLCPAAGRCYTAT